MQVYKAASQLRQEVKQKAKRAVEKNFLTFKISPYGPDGKKLSTTEMTEQSHKILEARVRFLKEDFKFTHGTLEIPEPGVDPSVSVCSMLKDNVQ